MEHETDNAPTITVGEKKLEVKLDIPAMRRLRRYEDPIDIVNVTDEGGLLEKMQARPDIAVDICFEGTAHDPRRPDDPEVFASNIAADALEEMVEAALDAVISFTPGRKLRAVLAGIREKTAKVQGKALDTIIDQIEKGELEKALEEWIDPEAKKPASSHLRASTAPSPSRSGSRKPSRSSGSTAPPKSESYEGTRSDPSPGSS